MFCPACKVEYRAGFTRCSDCDVELVESLEEPGESEADAATAANPLVRVLETTDPGLRHLARGILEQAGVPYEAADSNAPLLFPYMRSPAFMLWVRRSDLDAAKRALQEAIVQSPSPFPNMVARLADALQFDLDDDVESLDESESESEVSSPEDRWNIGEKTDDKGPEAIPEDWDPTTADTEIWSGTDRTLQETFVTCLRENGIPSRVVNADAAMRRLLVRAEDKDRAREILREIVEAAPPE